MQYGYSIYKKFKDMKGPLHFGENALPRLNDLLNTDIEG